MSVRHTPVLFITRHGFLVLSALGMLSPFIWMLCLSFGADTVAPAGLQNYRTALTATPLPTLLVNGICVCAVTLAVQIVIAAPCAYALAKHRFAGSNILFTLVLIGLLIPNEVLALPLFVAFARLGLLETFLALVLPFCVSPFAIFLLRQYFQSIPDDVIHAARLDGLSEWAIVWRVMVPMSTPALAAFAILSIVARWNSLFWPLIAVHDEALLPPAAGILYFSNQEDGSDFGPLMAAATLIVGPLVAGFLMLQRQFIAGLATGKTK